MRINSYIQKAGMAFTLMTLTPVLSNAYARTMVNDTFVKTETVITPKGTAEKNILDNAPDPHIIIAGEEKTAKITVDLSKNVLYKYDTEGHAQMAYLIASGKKNTPTDKGIRIVTHIETYPYRTAPRHTRRRKNPKAYGPKVICLNKIDKL